MCLTIPAQVVKIDGKQAIVRDSGGKEKKINVFLLSGLKKGDWLLYTTDLAIKRFPKRRQRYYRTLEAPQAIIPPSRLSKIQRHNQSVKTRDLTRTKLFICSARKKKKETLLSELIW